MTNLIKKSIKIVAIFVVLLVVTGLLVGNYFHQVVFDRDTKQGISQYEAEVAKQSFDLDWYKSLKKEIVTITSPFGYELDGIVLYHPDTVKQTMVIVHGLTSNKWFMMKFARIYHDAGFNVVLYDQRRHGMSGGDDMGYGYYEKFDLQQVVKFVRKQFPVGKIGIHGESMGGATTLLYSGLDKGEVSFYILDAPYSDLGDLFTYRLKADYGLPDFFIIDFASLITYLKKGFWFSDISPKAIVREVDVPMLFIHGTKDDFVPTFMSEELYGDKPGIKQLLLVPEAVHATSYIQKPELYRTKVLDFIKTAL